MDFNNVQNTHIVRASRLKIELDFYCKFSIDKVSQKFAEVFNAPVEVISDPDNFEPERDRFYIVKGYGYGKERYVFTSAMTDYTEGRKIVIKAFAAIKEWCYTDDTCTASIFLSNDSNLINVDFRKLNALKFVLEFNEDMMWRFFPNRKDSVYVQSVKRILPQNRFYRSENFDINNFNYILPPNDLNAVIFDNIKDGSICFRYIGGKDYEYKAVEALDVIGIFNSFVYKCLFEPSYTDKNKSELKKIVKSADKILLAYDSYDSFVKEFPDIKLTVDLDNNTQIMKSRYGQFRDQVFDILSSSDIRKCEINYDSALSKIQMQEAKGQIYQVEGWEFINCDLVINNGNDCSFFECVLNNSSISRCNLYRFSEIKYSKIEDTYINRTCNVSDSYIFGRISTIEAKVTRGIIADGRIGVNAHISPETELINYTKVYTK
jgi:hypothetical protein